MATTNGAASMKISLQVDNESALPRLLEGRDIAIIGRPFDNDGTAESRSQRYIIIHDRLECARRLRASLEEAADHADSPGTSYTQAITILQSSMPEIHQLVRLTKLLDDDEKEEACSPNDAAMNAAGIRSESGNHLDEIEKQQQLRAGRILRRQLRQFAKERNPGLELDDELESRHDALIRRSKLSKESKARQVDDGTVDGKVASSGGDKTVLETDKEGSLVKLGSANAENESIKNHASETQEAESHYLKGGSDFAIRESRKRLAKEAIDDARAKPEACGTKGIVTEQKHRDKITHALLAPPQVKNARTHQREHVSKSSVPANQKPAAAVSKTPTDAPPAPLPPRKCHECKSMCSQYRSCHYWTWSVKCTKKYCIPCLLSKYTLGPDVISDTNPCGIHLADEIGINPEHDKEWHCPSCVSQRESEEERERMRNNEAGRKSSRKSAIGNYSGFFQK